MKERRRRRRRRRSDSGDGRTTCRVDRVGRVAAGERPLSAGWREADTVYVLAKLLITRLAGSSKTTQVRRRGTADPRRTARALVVFFGPQTNERSRALLVNSPGRRRSGRRDLRRRPAYLSLLILLPAGTNCSKISSEVFDFITTTRRVSSSPRPAPNGAPTRPPIALLLANYCRLSTSSANQCHSRHFI